MIEQCAAAHHDALQMGTIKCLVWDLDNTLWRGVLAEGDSVVVQPEALRVISTLDQRGILQSIVSKNDADLALARLRQLHLAEYFLYPQINWSPKSESIRRIAQLLNIATDSIALVDDEPYERAEVSSQLADVLCIDAAGLDTLLDHERLTPRFVTDESRMRRAMYRSAQQRDLLEQAFTGPKEEFLASLGMILTLAPAAESDLQRLEELVARTHQLNTTGYIYSYDELSHFCRDARYELLVASLEDRYGSYGKVGLSLIRKDPGQWTIKTFLMSCRVLTRGVGAVFINYVLHRAHGCGVRLCAEMIRNDRNRMMYATYRLAGFRECGKQGAVELMEHDLLSIPGYPSYLQLRVGTQCCSRPLAGRKRGCD